MKNLAFFFLVSLSGCVVASAEYDGFQRYERVGDMMSDIVNDTFNGIVRNISEPFTVEDISLSFNDTNSVSGGGNITNATLFGLSKMVAPFIDVKFFEETVIMSIEIPDLTIAFNYWLDAVLGDLLPVYGSGNSSISMDNIAFNITGDLNTTVGVHVQVMSVSASVGSAKFNINGLLDNPQVSTVINTILNDTFCDFINNNREMISKVLNYIIQQFINGAGKLDNLHGIFKEVDY